MFNLFGSPERLLDESMNLMQEYAFLFCFYLQNEYKKRYEKDKASIMATAVVNAITFMPPHENHKQLIESGLVSKECDRLAEYKEMIIPYSYYVKLYCTALSLRSNDRAKAISAITGVMQDASKFGILNEDVFESTKNLIPKHFLNEAKIYLNNYQKIFKEIEK